MNELLNLWNRARGGQNSAGSYYSGQKLPGAQPLQPPKYDESAKVLAPPAAGVSGPSGVRPPGVGSMGFPAVLNIAGYRPQNMPNPSEYPGFGESYQPQGQGYPGSGESYLPRGRVYPHRGGFIPGYPVPEYPAPEQQEGQTFGIGGGAVNALAEWMRQHSGGGGGGRILRMRRQPFGNGDARQDLRTF